MAQDPLKSSFFKEAWVIFFILGIIMLNFPFLHIFNRDLTILGFPLLFLYFFIGWPLSILVIYLFTRRLDRDEEDSSDSESGGDGE